MKTIRLIVLAALLLPALVSQAQTKEETIAWLKEKLSTFMTSTNTESSEIKNPKLVNINECEIVLSYEIKSMSSEKNWYVGVFTFPTMGCQIENDGQIIFQNNVVKHTLLNRDYFYSEVKFISIDNREDKIYERIQKAMAHLATFCKKKTEAF